MLKCWSDYSSYDDFVCEKWGSIYCQGWGGYVLKEKLKLFKCCLKEWHQQHSQNLEDRITVVKNQISILDKKAEMSALLDEELTELHDHSVNLHFLP
jgi:hypothetical protein